MGVQYSYQHKHCATCAWWDGGRKLSNDNAWANLASSMQLGTCLNQKSVATKGKQVKANYACPKFAKWADLK